MSVLTTDTNWVAVQVRMNRIEPSEKPLGKIYVDVLKRIYEDRIKELSPPKSPASLKGTEADEWKSKWSKLFDEEMTKARAAGATEVPKPAGGIR